MISNTTYVSLHSISSGCSLTKYLQGAARNRGVSSGFYSDYTSLNTSSNTNLTENNWNLTTSMWNPTGSNWNQTCSNWNRTSSNWNQTCSNWNQTYSLWKMSNSN
ncbi:MAG: hypothetical protein V2A54_09105 [Bacteroidota bacterium]